MAEASVDGGPWKHDDRCITHVITDGREDCAESIHERRLVMRRLAGGEVEMPILVRRPESKNSRVILCEWRRNSVEMPL